MNAEWDKKIDAFWSSADETRPAAMFDAMRKLIEQRPVDDPDALYEWASVHDYLGQEHEAVPLYRAALDNGLSGPRRPQAIIQLASSMRNIGDPDAAVEVLASQPPNEVTGDAARAFLALALRDAGHPDEALAVALTALSQTLPLYSSAIENYAKDLGHAASTRAGSGHA